MQNGSNRGAVIQKMRGNGIAHLEGLTPMTAQHHTASGPNAVLAQCLGSASRDHMNVVPVHIAREHISPLCRITGGVHRAKGQHARKDACVPQDIHRAHAKVDRVGPTQRRHPQRAIRLDAFNHHGDFIHMCHDFNRTGRLGIVVLALDQTHHITRPIDPGLIAQRRQAFQANGAHLVFLTARPACPEQLGKQRRRSIFSLVHGMNTSLAGKQLRCQRLYKKRPDE